MSTTDVFVIGGGPAGLAAAIAARRKGFRVTVADPAQPPIDKACGEGLLPEAVAALEALGVAVDHAGGFPFRGIRFVEGAASVQACFPAGAGLGIRRTVLHCLLAEHAGQAGVSMLWGARVNAISPEGVYLAGKLTRCRWIVGADGGQSRVRKWAGLDAGRPTRRFGFRRHYAIAPWTDFIEIHWAGDFQVYVTPVGTREVCLAVLSRDRHFRLEQALFELPEIGDRLRGAEAITTEAGAVSASLRLKAVHRGRVALIGDAAGSVDALTGAGLCLAFCHAAALARALESGNLAQYQADYRRIRRRPEGMAKLLMRLDQWPWLRRQAFRAFLTTPRLFAKMVAVHAGRCLRPADSTLARAASETL